MPSINEDFLKEVFKETNAHLRSTDRKSLFVTGAYISLFSLFLSSLAIGRWSESTLTNSQWMQIAVQGFFLIIGSSIFVMQQWYRAWKEHYIDVCIEIRKHFMPEPIPGVLPYWLCHDVPASRISVDNLFKYLTAGVNFVLVFLICYALLDILPNRNLATLIVAVVILAYLGLLYITGRVIHKSRKLFA